MDNLKTEGHSYPILRTILSNLKLNIGIFVFYSVICIIIVFFVFEKKYTSEVSIIPSAASFSSSGILGNIGNLSKVAGLNIGGSTAQSQEMYVGIINSRRLLLNTINKQYVFNSEGHKYKGNLIKFLEINGETKRDTVERVLKQMREDVVYPEIDNENNILYLSVTTPYPELSAQVADFIAEQLNIIVRKEIQKEYRTQLRHLNNRITETQDSIKLAENNLKNFLEISVDPTTPNFIVEQLKLKRDLQVQTEIFIELKKQLEIFVVENLMNLSDIKILDHANIPFRKSRPKRLLLLISFVFICSFIHIGIIGVSFVYKNIISSIKS